MAAINTAVANQMSWPEIEELLDDAKQSGDPVARAIQAIKFDINHLTLLLKYGKHVRSVSFIDLLP